MSPSEGRPPESDAVTWLRDAVPAIVLTVVLSFIVSRTVHAAHGLWLVLTLLGGAAIAASMWGVTYLEERSAAISPTPQDAANGTTLGQVGLVANARPAGQPAPSAAVPGRAPGASNPVRWAPTAVPSISVSPTTVTVSKLGSAATENEDAFDVDLLRGRLVVSDGASSSFASREWSRALCNEMLSDPNAIDSSSTFGAAVSRAAARWKVAVAPTGDVAWWAQEGLDRGAFATLLAVDVATIDRSERWRAAAVGDSCLIQLRNGDAGWAIVTSFPIQRGESFTSYPDLVQTSSPEDVVGLSWAEGELNAGDVLLLATDAVSEWLLGQDSREANSMFAEATADQLAAEFSRLRESNRMANDDCTVVRMIAGRQALR